MSATSDPRLATTPRPSGLTAALSPPPPYSKTPACYIQMPHNKNETATNEQVSCQTVLSPVRYPQTALQHIACFKQRSYLTPHRTIVSRPCIQNTHRPDPRYNQTTPVYKRRISISFQAIIQ